MTIWRNYWTVAIRALAKSKTYSVINIAGLAIGMAACILILLYLRYERSYETWLPDVENTYQFQTYARDPDSGDEFFMQMASYTTKERIEKDFLCIIPSSAVEVREAYVWNIIHSTEPITPQLPVCDLE